MTLFVVVHKRGFVKPTLLFPDVVMIKWYRFIIDTDNKSESQIMFLCNSSIIANCNCNDPNTFQFSMTVNYMTPFGYDLEMTVI